MRHWMWAALREEAEPWARRLPSAKGKAAGGAQLWAISSQHSGAEVLSAPLSSGYHSSIQHLNYAGVRLTGYKHIHGGEKEQGLQNQRGEAGIPAPLGHDDLSPRITGLFFRPLGSLSLQLVSKQIVMDDSVPGIARHWSYLIKQRLYSLGAVILAERYGRQGVRSAPAWSDLK